MRDTIIIVAAGILLLVLIAASAILRWSVRHDRMVRRVEQAVAVTPSPEASMILVRDVRSAPRTEHRFRSAVARLLCIPSDMPNAHVVPPWLVLVAATVITAISGAALSLLLSKVLAALAAIAIGLLSARGIFGWELTRYQYRMLQQMPDLIELVVSATRAGLPASEAFAWVSRDAASPTREEFSRVVKEITLGRTPEQALMALHRRTRVNEYAIFAVTLAVQMRSGGRLAESIENLAATIRQRLSIAARARALAAESRLSARVLIAMPFIAGVAMSVMHPGYLAPLLFDPRGQRLLIGSAIALVIGALTMRRMIKGATTE